ncbi:putative pre-mRNA splicing factor [Xylariaceae sp. FL0594]|nr:putative pre-mRNA splicing factor [Xylariaceae sp. FL0594]
MANPVGEDSWLAYIEEQHRHATDLEARVKLVELFKAALADEPASLRLWLAYCEYFWSLFTDSQSPAASAAASSWSEEDRLLGRELFSFDAALSLWSDGYHATKYRISDSHLFWDRWVAIELEQLARTRTPSGVKRISHLFRDRLQVPHSTWDQTSQMFSEFLTTYNNAAYEKEFQNVTRIARDAKAAYELREPHELELAHIRRTGDREAERNKMRQYLDWEMAQTSHSTATAAAHDPLAVPLCLGLYARALTGIFAFDDEIWNNCAVYISGLHRQVKTLPPSYASLLPNMLEFFQRATKHCPGSGPLWSRYILTAEDAGWSFHNIESIKHAATNTKALDKNGMTGVLDMYTAWCGFLKRTAMDPNAPEDAADVAEVGLLAALEDVELWGKRLYQEAYKGDPNFRLERILIQFLTEVKGDADGARAHWNRLSRQPLLANSYDFWLNFYLWEMVVYASKPKAPSPTPPTPSTTAKTVRVPSLATDVLQRALAQRTLDWPERVMEVYLQHCNDYELPNTLHYALDTVHKTRRSVAKRRERESAGAAAAYAAQTEIIRNDVAPQPTPEDSVAPASPASAKRKRDAMGGSPKEAASKKVKADAAGSGRDGSFDGDFESRQAKPKRDRENTSVMVSNLPPDVTQTAIRRYFKEYGHINHLVVQRETDEKTASALIEFRSSEEADSALLRDQKYFNQSQITVQPGTRLTVFVSNYPPTADEAYIRRLFAHCGDIFNVRWPSLKYNTHRRFCYVSFRDPAAAGKATLMDGRMIEGKFKLQAKLSDPSHKKDREGAVAEGREVRVKGLHPSTQDNDLKSVFGKHGKVASVRQLTNLSGEHLGVAYITFETREQAQSALELDKTKFKSHILEVELCKETNYKPSATSRGEATSPPPAGRDGDVVMTDRPRDKLSTEQVPPTPAEIQERTLALANIPDTVNDARIRALVEEHGSIVKMVLRPHQGGAVVEFADPAMAGRAALALEGFEIAPQHKLRTGSVKDLFSDRGEKPANDASKTQRNWIPPPPNVRRPVLGRGGRRGGLGLRPAARKKTDQKDEQGT